MEEKKSYIIKNVGHLYLKHGIRNITMDNIASEFGVSKKTLYQYFADKEDLVSQVVDYFLEDAEFDVRNPGEGNAIDDILHIRSRVAYILKLYNNNIELELKRTYPSLYQKVYEAKRKRIFDNTNENLKKGIAEGLYRNNLEPSVVAKLVLGRTLFTMNPDYEVFEEYEVNSLAFFDSVLDYHMSAICTNNGLKYFKEQLNKIQNES